MNKNRTGMRGKSCERPPSTGRGGDGGAGNGATRNGCEMEMNDVRGIWKQLPHGVSQAQGCKSAALSTALTFWGEIVARRGAERGRGRERVVRRS